MCCIFRLEEESFWAASWHNQQMAFAPSEDSDQPAHPPSLIRVFAVRSMGRLGPNVASGEQRRFWSDWVDAQADLSSMGAQIILLVLSCRGSIFILNKEFIHLRKKNVFEKIWVFDFSKLALVCILKISGAWHAWHQKCVVIATEGVILWWPGNFIGGECLV